MSGYLYVGESDGGRIIRVGTTDLTQVTTAGTESVLSSATTWDAEPLGPSGDSVFRSLVVAISYTNGYNVSVTPVVDGVTLETQNFSGSGAGTADLQAWVKARGARCRVTVALTARTGDVRLDNVVLWYVPMRGIP